MTSSIEFWGNIAAIATSLVGVFGYLKYLCERRERRKILVEYLKREKLTGEDGGQRSILNVIRGTSLSESQIMEACYKNEEIKLLVHSGSDASTKLTSQMATHLLFEFNSKKSSSD